LPALSETYYVSKDGNNSNPGTLKAPWFTLAKAARTLVAGDTVLIKSGVYNETLWPENSGSANLPVCYFSYGDGEVIVSADKFDEKWGIFTIKGRGYPGYIKPVNYIHVKGITFRGSNHYGICIYGGDDGSSGTNCIFENIKCDSNSVGAYFSCCDLQVIKSEFTSNKFGGLWVFQGGKNIWISKSLFHHNGIKGNVDGMTLQDCEKVLIEDCEAFGQYDGFDVGSQENESTGPGCRYIIFRHCKAYNNYNGNFPSSTTLSGPICYQYCLAYDNWDWAGGMVLYEASRNAHIWNCTIANVNIGINFYQGPGPIYLYNNIIDASKEAVSNDARGKILSDNNMFNGEVEKIVKGSGTVIGKAVFIRKDSNDFRITGDNSDIIDKGRFFLMTVGSGKSTNQITVDSDPGIYFFPGDTIQIEKAGIRVVKSLSDTSITISGKEISYKNGQGIHLPYIGSAPDIGACEFAGNLKK
jgi:hypothetical protein